MKRNKLIASAIAGVLMLALTGCDMAVRNKLKVEQPDFSKITVALGGENKFNVTSVTVNGNPESFSGELAPASWTTFDECVVEIQDGDTAEFTFTQKNTETDAYKTWALAFTDNTEKYGNFLRADTWVNPVSPWKNGGIWSTGGCAANMKYENDYTYLKVGASLTDANVVVVTVKLNGNVITYEATVDGTKALSGSSNDWANQIVWDD